MIILCTKFDRKMGYGLRSGTTWYWSPHFWLLLKIGYALENMTGEQFILNPFGGK